MGRTLGATTAIDAGRVVTVAGNGVVRILSLRGRALRSWSVGESVVTARLRGRTLAVQHGRTIDLYDAKTGAKTTSAEMLTDGGPLRRLPDIQVISSSTRPAAPSTCFISPGSRPRPPAPRCRTVSRRAPRAGRPVRELERDVRPPARSRRVHPSPNDRGAFVGGGDEGDHLLDDVSTSGRGCCSRRPARGQRRSAVERVRVGCAAPEDRRSDRGARGGRIGRRGGDAVAHNGDPPRLSLDVRPR